MFNMLSVCAPQNQTKKATRCPMASSECMYVNMLIGCVHARVPIDGTCSLPCVCVCKKREVSFGKLGAVKLLDQNYARDLIVMMQY